LNPTCSDSDFESFSFASFAVGKYRTRSSVVAFDSRALPGKGATGHTGSINNAHGGACDGVGTCCADNCAAHKIATVIPNRTSRKREETRIDLPRTTILAYSSAGVYCVVHSSAATHNEIAMTIAGARNNRQSVPAGFQKERVVREFLQPWHGYRRKTRHAREPVLNWPFPKKLSSPAFCLNRGNAFIPFQK
jgi:hypothetical protein